MPEFRMFGGTVRNALVHALTQYDIRQSRGKHYNPYALAQYFKRIDDLCEDIAKGASPRDAICAAFTGPLLACALRAINATAPSQDELSGAGKYTYQPSNERL